MQHIAFLTDDIVGAVRELRARGVDCLPIPDTYYDMLEQRLRSGGPTGEPIREDLEKVGMRGKAGIFNYFWVTDPGIGHSSGF